MKKFFMYAGTAIIFLTVIMFFLTGLYPDYLQCKNIIKDIPIQETILPTTELEANTALVIRCISIESDVHTGYFLLIVGIAVLLAGYITRKS